MHELTGTKYVNIYSELLLENSLGEAPAGRWDQKENLQYPTRTQL
jgi:hypothetical protein